MISKKMEEALNQQINAEFYSSYLYLAMAADFEAKNLAGFANWMKTQAREEWGHGLKMYGYIYEQNGKVTLAAIDAPPSMWKTPLEAFEAVYQHEQHITSLIHKLVALAIEDKDYATNMVLLHWFVKEQVEEEANALAIVEKLKMIGDNVPGLFMIDAQLGQRKAD